MPSRENPRPPHAAALVARRLRELNLRKQDLAAAVSVTPVTLSRWLTGRNTPSLGQVVAVAAFCRDRDLALATLWTTPEDEPLPETPPPPPPQSD